MPKLKAQNFAYPFEELDTPFQYAHKLMGNPRFANQHTYFTMAEQGRMDSFNLFMEGKFMRPHSVPDRLKVLGYDLQSVLNEATPENSITMVDIAGGTWRAPSGNQGSISPAESVRPRSAGVQR